MTPICSPYQRNSIFRVPQPNRQITPAILASMSSDMSLCATKEKELVMTINLTVPQNMQELRPRITVVGVGGAGCNAVNNMINADLEGVDFLVANTDGQAWRIQKQAKNQLGSAITQVLAPDQSLKLAVPPPKKA